MKPTPLLKEDVLNEWREPADECERLASVAVHGATAQNLPSVLLVESQPDVGHKPTKLNDDEGDLEPNDAHDSRKCDIGHRQRLVSGAY